MTSNISLKTDNHGISIGKTIISDNVVLMTSNAGHLQHLINGIAAFSLQGGGGGVGVIGNTGKTEILIFNKAGRFISETVAYNNINLKTLEKYVYIGKVFPVEIVPPRIYT